MFLYLRWYWLRDLPWKGSCVEFGTCPVSKEGGKSSRSMFVGFRGSWVLPLLLIEVLYNLF